ncbi:MAG: 16S rRNA (adenine(1518)-N(6)/adenine(1519)-N(6))-dimethyltransferase RsmA, partial [Pseudomonadota bacterium]|nr:16S rRNA (adenine(1518)-N(6)/adenine(1519)-N(6))-dimethyltransferase RsmA [Pseudomonadota bacterium]
MDAYSREKKKQFGQNFLIDVGYIHQIVSLLSPQEGDMIIEIGPGTGALTEILLNNAQVLAVEIDHDLITFLQKRFEANARFRLLAADVLTLAQQDYGDNLFRWFGNLPYNISTPFLLSLLDKLPIIKDGLFMVQYEVAMRMIADPGSKDYGRLSVILQRYFDMDSVLVVPP